MTAVALSKIRTHCTNGHELTPETSFVDASGRRYCTMCRLRPPATHCQRGHVFDEANTFVTAKGRRECRTCRNAQARTRYQRTKAKRRPTTNPPDRSPKPAPTPSGAIPPNPDHTHHAAVTMPCTSQCQRCGNPVAHNVATPDTICDPCQVRQRRREARRRYAARIGWGTGP